MKDAAMPAAPSPPSSPSPRQRAPAPSPIPSPRKTPRTRPFAATASPFVARSRIPKTGWSGAGKGGGPDESPRRSLLVVPQPLFLSRDRSLPGDDPGSRSRNRPPPRLSARHPPARFLREEPSELARLHGPRRDPPQPISWHPARPAAAGPDRAGHRHPPDRGRSALHLPPRPPRPGRRPPPPQPRLLRGGRPPELRRH